MKIILAVIVINSLGNPVPGDLVDGWGAIEFHSWERCWAARDITLHPESKLLRKNGGPIAGATCMLKKYYDEAIEEGNW